jgi:hypothetical protein
MPGSIDRAKFYRGLAATAGGQQKHGKQKKKS